MDREIEEELAKVADERDAADAVAETVSVKDLDGQFYETMADLIMAKAQEALTPFDRTIEDRLRTGLVKGVEADGNHLNLPEIYELEPKALVQMLRNINNHRSRMTNVVSDVPSIPFFSPLDELEI